MWNIPTKEQLARIPRMFETDDTPLEEKTIYLHFFFGDCDWFVAELHREGVNLDLLRPLMGHGERDTTGRYTTIDRLEAGKVLTLLPGILPNGMKKASNQ